MKRVAMTQPQKQTQPSAAPAPFPQDVAIPAQRGAMSTQATTSAAPNKNVWKWIAGSAAVLLAITMAALIGRASAPSQPVQALPTAGPTTPVYTPAPVPVPTTFTPLPGSAPTVYTGRGDDVVSITKDPGPAILQFECLKCTSNTIVRSDGRDSLLVNTIGNYSGRQLIDIQDGSTTTTVTVKATGTWR
jgi:hypothetical protein